MKLSIPQMALISRLLDEALPLDAAGRRAWLEKLSPEYQGLAEALREVLLPGDFPGTPPKFTFADDASGLAARDLRAGTRVGPYELMRPLGAGGMAQVWLARRADGAFKREVALKLPQLTGLRADLTQRFARERDILASLEHPQIARFYDAGIDPDGLPYVAMEFVQGQVLTDWCDGHQLGIAARLELFVQVLVAVQYAHEKQVIHRDLKPSNILVTEAGEVRLLDFGVAKLLEAEEPDHTQLTSVYGRALTPDYASPELLRGDPVDARSDLYSLGVLLYELLTGVRPYRLKSAASIGMLEQAIATVDVKKPSALLNEDAVGARGTTRESLARQLRGDLDAIALKTLAKEPAERYASAAALAEDLRRYFAGKPIRARRAGLLYRLRKFVRRNKTVVGVTSTAVAAILATIGYALHREAVNQAKIAAKEVAVSAAAQASTQASAELGAPVTAFSPPGHSVAVLPFVDMSERKDQEYFSDGLSEELIDLLARNRNLQVTARTSSFYFKGKQVTIAEIAKTLGVANVLEGSVRKSGNTLRVTAQLIRAADSYHLWSGTYDRNPDDLFKVQDAIAGEVVSALKVLLSPNATSAVADAPSVEANDLYLQATFFRAKGSAAGVNKAGELLARAVAVDPSFAKAWATLSRIKVRQVIDELIPAAGLERARLEGRRAAERAVALAPGLTEPHVALGRVYLLDMDVARAAAEFHRALEIDPRNADATLQLGFIALEHGQIEEQIRMSEQALALDPLDINIMTVLGQAYLNNGDPAPAERVFRRERELAPARKGVDFRLGSALLMLGKPKEALELMENEVGGDDDSRQWVRAMVYPALGRKPQADAIMAALDEDPRTLTPLDIAEAHATRGEIDLAFDWLERQYRTDPKRLSVIFWTSYLLRPLRGDPRYQVLRRRLNLPE